MPCAGFSPELYDLYSLGVLEADEAAGIDDHLRNACGTCVDHFHQSLERASALALAVPSVAPPRHLRSRIAGSVRPARSGTWAWLQAPALGWGVAAACLLGVIWAGVYFGSIPVLQQPVVLTRVSPPSTVPAITLPPKQEIAPPIQTNKTADPELARALEHSQSATSALNRDVEQERIRIAALETEVRTRDRQLASVERERAALQTQVAAASGNGDARVQELQKQLASDRRQVQELTQQVRFYQTAIQSQRGDLDRDVQLISLLSSPTLRVLDLQATEQGGAASARALLANNTPIVFYASKLPPLPAGRTYQLWVMRNRGRAVTSGGVFQPDASQAAMLSLSNANDVAAITALAVTEEPSGGQPLPTGHKILIGTAKS